MPSPMKLSDRESAPTPGFIVQKSSSTSGVLIVGNSLSPMLSRFPPVPGKIFEVSNYSQVPGVNKLQTYPSLSLDISHSSLRGHHQNSIPSRHIPKQVSHPFIYFIHLCSFFIDPIPPLLITSKIHPPNSFQLFLHIHILKVTIPTLSLFPIVQKEGGKHRIFQFY